MKINTKRPNALKSAVWLLIVAALMLISSCRPAPLPPLPTVAVMPSDTITPTPSNTFTPTITPTFTPTDTPTETPTYTPSITPTPSNTPTATTTETPTITPTFTPTDTPLPTDTPTATNTATATSTPTATVGPEITQFVVEPSTVTSGGQVFARWTTTADRVTLELLAAGNVVIETNEVGPQGTRNFTVSSANGVQQTFRLTAYRGGNHIFRTAFVVVSCASPWFFSPAPSTECPQAQQQGAFTFQQFERGVAIYVSNTNLVYFLANENMWTNVFTNEWNQSIILPTVQPPAGFIDPQGPIGYVWRNKPWADGRNLQQVVGWPTAQAINYNGTIQKAANGDVYIKGQSTGVYRIAVGNTTVGGWTILSIN